MKYKAIFISDVHLGSSSSSPKKINKFLKENEFEKIFLVGDIIDIWAIKRKLHWQKEHNEFLRIILKLSKKMPVTYIIGNHDEEFMQFNQQNFGNIIFKEQDIIKVNEKKYVVIHGQQFDGPFIKNYKNLQTDFLV